MLWTIRLREKFWYDLNFFFFEICSETTRCFAWLNWHALCNLYLLKQKNSADFVFLAIKRSPYNGPIFSGELIYLEHMSILYQLKIE